jgi:hypothetical protein
VDSGRPTMYTLLFSGAIDSHGYNVRSLQRSGKAFCSTTSENNKDEPTLSRLTSWHLPVPDSVRKVR